MSDHKELHRLEAEAARAGTVADVWGRLEDALDAVRELRGEAVPPGLAELCEALRQPVEALSALWRTREEVLRQRGRVWCARYELRCLEQEEMERRRRETDENGPAKTR